jgi:serine/threonine protein kinase
MGKETLAPFDYEEGQVIADQYVVRERFRGGMSHIYVVERDGRKYVLKQMRHGVEALSQNEKRIWLEIEPHEHAVPKFYEDFYWNDRYFIRMEYIEGETLDRVAKKNLHKPGWYRDVIAWGIELCDIISKLHDRGIVYRDMKPGNVMLLPESRWYTISGEAVRRLKLIDFGISRYYDPDKRDTVMAYTEGFAAPEVLEGRSEPRSDIYSLGATLYALLTGEKYRVFDGPDTVHHYPPDTPRALIEVIETALSYKITDRFATASEMRQALEQVLHGKSGQLAAARLTKWWKRNQLLRLSALFVLLSLAAVFYLIWTQIQDKRAITGETPILAESAELEIATVPEQIWFARTPVDLRLHGTNWQGQFYWGFYEVVDGVVGHRAKYGTVTANALLRGWIMPEPGIYRIQVEAGDRVYRYAEEIVVYPLPSLGFQMHKPGSAEALLSCRSQDWHEQSVRLAASEEPLTLEACFYFPTEAFSNERLTSMPLDTSIQLMKGFSSYEWNIRHVQDEAASESVMTDNRRLRYSFRVPGEYAVQLNAIGQAGSVQTLPMKVIVE